MRPSLLRLGMICFALNILSPFSKTWAEDSGINSSLSSPGAEPSENIPLIRRVVVFPLITPSSHQSSAEKAWWRIREILTENRRFLVASKRFMVQKDVFQPRSPTNSADAILLGRLLDAHALIFTVLQERTLTMSVLSGIDGMPLWQRHVQLHPSLPLDQQLDSNSEKLIRLFFLNIPYNGFQIVDPLIGSPVFEEGDIKQAKIDIGSQTKPKPGDPVHWITVDRINLKPLFLDGSNIRVIAEGEVISQDRDIILVKILRAKDVKLLGEKSLVNLPHSRTPEDGSPPHSPENSLITQVTSLPETQPKSEEARPLLTALSMITNIVLMAVLLF